MRRFFNTAAFVKARDITGLVVFLAGAKVAPPLLFQYLKEQNSEASMMARQRSCPTHSTNNAPAVMMVGLDR